MTEITDSLIKQLEEISTDTLRPLERRLTDTAVWFYKNKDLIPRENLTARVDFLESTISVFLEMVAMSVDRLQVAEGRQKSESLWLPQGVEVKGDMRRFS